MAYRRNGKKRPMSPDRQADGGRVPWGGLSTLEVIEGSDRSSLHRTDVAPVWRSGSRGAGGAGPEAAAGGREGPDVQESTWGDKTTEGAREPRPRSKGHHGCGEERAGGRDGSAWAGAWMASPGATPTGAEGPSVRGQASAFPRVGTTEPGAHVHVPFWSLAVSTV